MRSQIRTAWRKADGSAAWNFFRYGQCCRRRNIAARQMESWMLWRVFSPDLRDVSLPGMRSIWDRRCIVTGMAAMRRVPWTRQPDRQTVQKAIGALSVQTMRRETRKSHKLLSLTPPAESTAPISTVCSTWERSPGV